MTAQPVNVSLEDRPLVVGLAGEVLQRTAPEELVLLEETAGSYFENPQGLLEAGDRDEPLGFGVALQLLAPYVLAVASAAVQFLLGLMSDAARDAVKDELKDRAKSPVHAWVRRLLGAGDGDEQAVPLDGEQSRRLWQVTHDTGVAVGLDGERAALLANAVLGSLTAGG